MNGSSGFDRTDVARCWAGFASFGAGLIHVAVVREHLDEWWVLGVFFTVVALAQLGWGLAALHGRTVPIPQLTIAATIAIIALWAVTRTTGLAGNPVTAAPEPVGRADLLSVVLEAVLILCILAAFPRRASAQVEDRLAPTNRGTAGRFVALLAVGALAVSAVATPAMATTEPGEHPSQHHGH